MRHRRKSLGLAVAVCAFALVATPALAHEFTASKAGKTKGITETEQLFKFGPFHITCERAVARGLVAEGSSKTYATVANFSKCSTAAKISNQPIKLPTRFLTPLAVEYHANGFVETGSEVEEVEGAAVLAGGTVEIKVYTGITAEHHASRCTISWPEETLPIRAIKKPEGEYSAASFSNVATANPNLKKFPDGFQHSIEISNSFKGIKATFAGEPCEAWGKKESDESSGGTYFGTFPQILQSGNFEFS
jgi:hypothetical protein